MQGGLLQRWVSGEGGMYTGVPGGEAWVPVAGNPTMGVRFNVPRPFPTGPRWLSQSEPA